MRQPLVYDEVTTTTEGYILSDTNTILSNGKHTVFFARKISDGNYGSVEASCFFQVDTDPGATNEQIAAAAAAAYVAVKSVVLTQLGITHTLSDEGVVVEDAPVVTVPTPKAAMAQRDATTQLRESFGGGELVHDSESTTFEVDPLTLPKYDQEKWLKARLATNPEEFFDNRPKKESGDYKPTAPDFKHKKSGLAIFPPRKK